MTVTSSPSSAEVKNGGAISPLILLHGVAISLPFTVGSFRVRELASALQRLGRLNC